MKECQYCKEFINNDACVCRYCKRKQRLLLKPLSISKKQKKLDNILKVLKGVNFISIIIFTILFVVFYFLLDVLLAIFR